MTILLSILVMAFCVYLLAIITEITVKLLPSPDIAQVVMAAFDSVDAAGAVIAGPAPRGLSWYRVRALPGDRIEVDRSQTIEPGTMTRLG